MVGLSCARSLAFVRRIRSRLWRTRRNTLPVVRARTATTERIRTPDRLGPGREAIKNASNSYSVGIANAR
jgi:hypothetical protein